jgi:Chalcone isomerase-like
VATARVIEANPGMFSRRCFSVLSLALAGELVVLPALAGQCAGVTLPDAVSVDGKPLVLNGMGLREATVFKVDVYVAALYVENRSADAEALVSGEQLKQLRIRFVRNVSRDDMLENMERAFRAGAGAKFAALEARFNELKAWMPSLHSGDEFLITYRPDIGIDVQLGSKSLGPVAGKDYADAVLRIWLGDHPPTPELKRGLLGGPCG